MMNNRAPASIPARAADLPLPFADWFARRGWTPHAYQLSLLHAGARGESCLLIAPTGGGKTLAGFLPSLVELSQARPASAPAPRRLHTLYVSPLKALAVDIHRNLTAPVEEMGLDIRVETRTGDTPQAKRRRQRRLPPDLLLTTPESLALLLSYADAPQLFAHLRAVVVDEAHALAGNKRGNLLALGLARLARLAPGSRVTGLSATVAHPQALAQWLASGGRAVRIVRGEAPKRLEGNILEAAERMPWAGHMALYALPEVYTAIKRHRTTLVFVNTRAQAELVFQGLWRLNDDGLAIALHHGSLAPEQRRKVEAAMGRGDLRAVVATSSLDLGVDWAAVDLVVQVGAPKGASRLIQRIGRANHRLDEPSRALLVPANRFEVLECRAALDAMRAGTLDGDPPAGPGARPGGLDVLAQHLMGSACARPFRADDMYAEAASAAPYAALTRPEFDAVLNFVATGGYALAAYAQWHRLRQDGMGAWKVAAPQFVRRYRMNVGTIVESPMLKVRLRRGPFLGEVEEHFAQFLAPGDSFVFAGRLLRFDCIREHVVECSPAAAGGEPKVPAYAGGRLPLTTQLAERVRGMLADRASWRELPEPVAEWLRMQEWRSELPPKDGLLVEAFPRGDRGREKHFLVAYCFEGRNAHQTLGMLLTRRMERLGLMPLGFVATDYVIAAWSLKPARRGDVPALFDEDMLGDDLEAWMDESSMLKRCFRNVAVIAGLIERRHPGEEKTGRQVTFNSDLIYDVLRKHDPGHVLLRATRADAASGLTDVARLARFLKRVNGRIVYRALERVTPLALPVLLEIGREEVSGRAVDAMLDEAAREERERALIAEALSLPRQGGLAV
jgi:ATP-dependent Lhr-like helicase